MTQEHDAETVERMAAAMWRAETVAAGTPESVTLRRTPETFRDMHEASRAKWLKFARAALAAMPPREVTGWQSIETAPKDGTILAVCMDDYTQLVIWDQEIDYGEEGISQIWRSVLTDAFVIPTHWMPLPPAPEDV